ncbi:hypothetical protein [Tardiphaga sp. OK245]|uniref:hypothetical protein n=1 Tax=Tardiphaga sp. OK245 TaxID=1855306 RepID=UPI0008A76525|nr:hypothetical protein [Tardiphaga sp. OK245]SEI19621.1 hypothetical protein SAMN05216367_4918 [Tardiphaga sp. OK245]
MITDFNPKRSSIGKRINRKLEVLQEWERSGIPIGQMLPASLAEVRTWSQPSLGVQAIGSPSDFTTTHPQHGNSIKAIWASLERLKAKYLLLGGVALGGFAKEAAATTHLAGLERRIAEGEERLVHVASQWTMTKQALESEKRRAQSFAQMVTRKDEIISEKNEEIAELQRQLKSRRGVRLVD